MMTRRPMWFHLRTLPPWIPGFPDLDRGVLLEEHRGPALEPRNSLHVLIDENSEQRQDVGMGKAERPICPRCGARLVLALPPEGKGERTFQCFDCDRLDPLQSDRVIGWLSGELGRSESTERE
jgi:hypothetical protein